MSAQPHVIQPVGVLNADSGQLLRDQVTDAIRAGHGGILIDAQSITFMDSNGFSALVACLKTVRESEVDLALCSLQPQLKLILEITGTDGIFSIYPDRATYEQRQSTGTAPQTGPPPVI